MAPPFLFDVSALDPDTIVVPLDEIRKINPQRHEMEQLSGILYLNVETGTVIGIKHVTMDEFWVRGHIPGRPLMPGVLMIEAAAQLCSYMTRLKLGEDGFIGFAKCDDTRFRGIVTPPSSLIVIAQMAEIGRRRAVAKCQGVCKGTLVFESTITGMAV